MNKQKKYIIKTKNLLYFLLLIPFIRTRTMEDFPNWLKLMYNGLALLSSFAIFINIIKSKKNIKQTKKIFLIFIFIFTYLLTTIINNPSNLKTCYNCIFFLAIATFINNEMQDNPKDLLKILTYIYITFILINNILVIIFPEGFYVANAYHHGHLLGDDNSIIYVALPGMIIASLYSIIKYGKISKFTWFNIIFCELIFIKLWAASAIISFAVFIFLVFLGNKNIKLSPMKLFIALISFCLIIFIGFNTPVLVNFITNYLHKDISFSGRTYLWKYGFDLIKQKPIFGYGGYFVEGRSVLHRRLYPVHTTYLQLLIDGGIILFSQFILIIFNTFKKLTKYKNYLCPHIISAGLIGIGISYTFEQAGLYHLMIIIPIAYNIEKIIVYENNWREQK